MIAITAGACISAIAFRDHFYARIYAYQIARADNVLARVSGVTALCGLGDAARGGISALTGSDDQELRQLGVIALQQVDADWRAHDLRVLLHDESADIREAAAVALARLGDEAALPVLRNLYRGGDNVAVSLSVEALSAMGTPPAHQMLLEFASEPATPNQRVPVIAALEEIASVACVEALMPMLADDRACPKQRMRIPPESHQIDIADYLTPATAPVGDDALVSISSLSVAERAADALAKITGINPPFAGASDAERRAALDAWQRWYDEHAAKHRP